jgi:hypothetical protein
MMVMVLYTHHIIVYLLELYSLLYYIFNEMIAARTPFGARRAFAIPNTVRRHLTPFAYDSVSICFTHMIALSQCYCVSRNHVASELSTKTCNIHARNEQVRYRGVCSF